jgi:hypothetical protein
MIFVCSEDFGAFAIFAAVGVAKSKKSLYKVEEVLWTSDPTIPLSKGDEVRGWASNGKSKAIREMIQLLFF